MAQRLVPGEYDQLHHLVAAGVWDAAPLEAELLVPADRLIGDDDALVIDDTGAAEARPARNTARQWRRPNCCSRYLLRGRGAAMARGHNRRDRGQADYLKR
jgi:hypothetical protein